MFTLVKSFLKFRLSPGGVPTKSEQEEIGNRFAATNSRHQGQSKRHRNPSCPAALLNKIKISEIVAWTSPAWVQQ